MQYVPLISVVVAKHNSGRKSKQIITLFLNFIVIFINAVAVSAVDISQHYATCRALKSKSNPVYIDEICRDKFYRGKEGVSCLLHETAPRQKMQLSYMQTLLLALHMATGTEN